MTEAASVLISVRGDAEQVVAPDAAVLRCALRAVAPVKADALQQAAAAQAVLLDDLAALGGVPLRPESMREPLAWSVQSATTEPEFDFDEMTGHRPTGNVVAVISVVINMRDFAQLADLDAALARHEALSVHSVSWHVDADNAAWPAVRAEAIDVAMARGRDYAAALGGTLMRVEHIADAGLLGESYGASGHDSRQSGHRLSFAGGDEAGTPSLDPVPQQLMAVIEARFTASVPALA